MNLRVCKASRFFAEARILYRSSAVWDVLSIYITAPELFLRDHTHTIRFPTNCVPVWTREFA